MHREAQGQVLLQDLLMKELIQTAASRGRHHHGHSGCHRCPSTWKEANPGLLYKLIYELGGLFLQLHCLCHKVSEVWFLSHTISP